MNKTEKEIKELAEDIVLALNKLLLGNEPGLMSDKVYKKLAEHPKFNDILSLYKQFIQLNNGIPKELNDFTRLTEFRFKMVNLYETE